jgi:hypothetical protein
MSLREDVNHRFGYANIVLESVGSEILTLSPALGTINTEGMKSCGTLRLRSSMSRITEARDPGVRDCDFAEGRESGSRDANGESGESMSSALAEPPRGLGAMDVGKMLALPGFASERPQSVERLAGPAQELFRNVAATLDEFVLYAIERRTASEFRAAFEKVFPKYFEGVLGLSLIARTVVPQHVLEVLSAREG